MVTVLEMRALLSPVSYTHLDVYKRQGYDYEEAVGFREMLKDLIRERLGIEEIGIYQIGATIGVHTGPYPIGIGIVRHAEV